MASIIIATYNGEEHLRNCIPTVQGTNYVDFEVIICDDNSTDSSQKYLQEIAKSDSRFTIIKNTTNQGAAKTRNNAVKYATGEVLVFLDNDTQVDKDWLIQAIQLLENNPNTGAVQSVLIQYDDRTKIQLSGVKLIPHTCWGIPLEQGENVQSIITEPNQIIALSAAMAVRKEVFEKIGGFDEVLAVYTEDLEFSLRIWLAGYQILSCPTSYVYHWTKKVEDRKKMQATRENIYYHLAKNTLRTILKDYSFISILTYLPAAIAILLYRVVLRLYLKDGSALIGTSKGIYFIFLNMKSLIHDRHIVQSKIRRVTDKELFKKIIDKESLFEIYQKYFSKKVKRN